MPTFGLDDPNLNGVIRYFGAISNIDRAVPDARRASARPARHAAGKQMFELLKCQQCHVLGAIPKDQPTSNLAPDLRMAPERLQAGLDPAVAEEAGGHPAGHAHAGVLAATIPKSSYPQLGGDAEAQIRAIRDHLLTLQGRTLAEDARRPGGGRRTSAAAAGRGGR